MSGRKFEVGKYYLFYFSKDSWHGVWGLAKVLKRTPEKPKKAKNIHFSIQIIGTKQRAFGPTGYLEEVKQENIVDKYGKDGKIVWKEGNELFRAKIRTSDDDSYEYVSFDKHPTRYLRATNQTDRLDIDVEEVQDDDRKLPPTATGKRKRDDKNMLKIKF